MGEGMFGEIALIFRAFGKNADAIAKADKRQQTVVVHPQISPTEIEAKRLANNWKAREEKQLLENMARLKK
jgi:formylmethanofuran dehydrogenase subunit E